MHINFIELIKKIILIETIYQHINIKKALIISNDNNKKFIQLLKHFDHNVCTYKNINDFINYKKRLLVISYNNLENHLNNLLEDTCLDTIFWINDSNKKDLLHLFKKNKVIIYNI